MHTSDLIQTDLALSEQVGMFLARCLFWFEPLYSCTVRRCLIADGESNFITSVRSDAEKSGCEGNRISAERVCVCACAEAYFFQPEVGA